MMLRWPCNGNQPLPGLAERLMDRWRYIFNRGTVIGRRHGEARR